MKRALYNKKIERALYNKKTNKMNMMMSMKYTNIENKIISIKNQFANSI